MASADAPNYTMAKGDQKLRLPRESPPASGGVRVELARSHVFDHTLTQRTDSVSFAHGGSILSEVDDTSILRTGLSAPLSLPSQLVTGPSPHPPRSGLERSDFVLWP